MNMAGSDGMSIAVSKYEGFKSCACDVIHFKLVREEKDIDDDSLSFHPDMTHQLFGESESIFGYKDLKVEIFCTAARMKTYVKLKYTEKISPDKYDEIYPDNVERVLSERLQPGFYTNLEQFIAQLPQEVSFTPFGELIHSYTVTTELGSKQFEIYKTGIESPGFRDYHERLQPFLLFYVDAASFIDVDDDRWTYFLMFEKYQNSGVGMYAFVGYMTVYNYYAYPEKIRPRVSQVLVMPPYQKQGHGATMIQTFYNDCYKRPQVLDITVEDPSENFQRVRDYVDCKNCMQLPAFSQKRLLDAFSEEMVLEARAKLKINRRQARRVYEILRLKATNCSNPSDYKSYRIELKKRLNQPFQKNGRDFEKLQRALQPTELAATMNNISEEQRLEFLEKQFQECVEEYRVIINRLARD